MVLLNEIEKLKNEQRALQVKINRLETLQNTLVELPQLDTLAKALNFDLSDFEAMGVHNIPDLPVEIEIGAFTKALALWLDMLMSYSGFENMERTWYASAQGIVFVVKAAPVEFLSACFVFNQYQKWLKINASHTSPVGVLTVQVIQQHLQDIVQEVRALRNLHRQTPLPRYELKS